MSKFYIKTFGCKLNQFDSEKIREGLTLSGYFETDNVLEADIIIVNSCGVTNKAEKEAFYTLRNLIRKNPDAKKYFIGCFVEPKDYEKTKFLKGKDKFNIPEIKNLPFFPLSQQKHARPLIYIQNGCDLKCAYCIVPKFRGKSVSVETEKILEQIEFFVNHEKKEVVLTGIHLGLWGHDFSPKKTILNLLEEIEKRFGGKIKIRISSLDSNEIDNDLIDFFANSKTIQPHFHIPLQSGSDKILKLMRRRYTIRQFAETVEKIKEKVNDCCIGADIIVGFPKESEDDFNESYNFVKTIPLDYLHVFPFSPRIGTDAYSMEGQVDEKIKKERVKKLRQLSDSKREKFIRNFLNKERVGIAIYPDLILTDNYIQVRVEQEVNPSSEYKVKIKKILSPTLVRGEVI
ncbi:threonylcarbamoyladenosine tRNA methylthiotransferase MtaB [Thermotomaculum hydrothermale]|uniref:Threonylcarbamoyladenosine tRNA methylthiotransferase MtaB n=1 Tax=Thermotomaculum hydrothermale TaxID=981385 RepID=A0A7R6SY11_9BACT|nr:MiaB/RimO family radical SAM methylthiotransferase [Thermotomaculum hydrothermale]BBB32279.1 threonylcarbamoyladenosine tRNA methylthiotransferase MtaB [Thermotomaculum hydrothermale]